MEGAEKVLRNRRRNMGKIRKQYYEDFKKNAVKLSHESPKPVKEIVEDLGIHENLLYN